MIASTILDIFASHPLVVNSLPFAKVLELVVICHHLMLRISMINKQDEIHAPISLPLSVQHPTSASFYELFCVMSVIRDA
ncbi:hypothetical protein SCHPADRAFT_902349 [Schizopora paradoxa]|uniref:Uncharacterized protein n=1 Tax=Schizopora paradoxa TaxID=27342 RepID=A0A0H2SEJ4_9AGAM|nr:hypothetical protein SCHPADRAFT_902349 [Schizopora paradoxa]